MGRRPVHAGFNVTFGACAATSNTLVWLRASSISAGDRGDGDGRVLQVLLAELGGDDDLLQKAGFVFFLLRRNCRGAQQTRTRGESERCALAHA